MHHVVANCPYNSDNDEDEKNMHKKDKKEKKEKKEKRMTFQKKKKGGGYVVTWDSDGSSDSDDGKKSIKKALASIAINNKPSIFDTPSTCLMAKTTKVKYDVSDDENESDDDEEYSKEELMDMCEQVHTCFEMKRKECKELHKKIKSLEQWSVLQ